MLRFIVAESIVILRYPVKGLGTVSELDESLHSTYEDAPTLAEDTHLRRLP